MIANISGVQVFYDDILLATKTKKHVQCLRQLLQRLSGSVLVQSAVEYFGLKLSALGVSKTENKVRAIRNVPALRNMTEVKSFLEQVRLYGSFMKLISDLAAVSLYQLLKKNVQFRWTRECGDVFRAMKEKLALDTVFMRFDPHLPSILATNESLVGISDVLSHRLFDGTEQPIAYHLSALNETERRYTQLDRGALAIKQGVNKFQMYVFGRSFALVTDSSPLLSIFSPPAKLPALTTARLQHYAIFLQSFNYDFVYRTSANSNAMRFPAYRIDRRT